MFDVTFYSGHTSNFTILTRLGLGENAIREIKIRCHLQIDNLTCLDLSAGCEIVKCLASQYCSK